MTGQSAEQAGQRIADLAARLRAAGTDLPVEALQKGAQAAASTAAYDAARRRLPAGVQVQRTGAGVRLVASGRGAKTVAATFRRELLRRLPEVKQAVRAEVTRKIR